MNFPQRLELLMKRKSKTAYRVKKDLSFSNSIVEDWIAGRRLPSAENLVKLADYFAVSLDYLVGRSEDPVVSVSVREDVPALSDEELELLNIFRSLSKKGKWVVLGEATRQSQFEKLDGDKGEAKEAK